MNPEALIAETPTDDYLENLLHIVGSESDRGVAIMCSAMVEQALESALRKALPHMNDTELAEWFEGHNAPFRNFDAKIKLARGLKICDDSVEIKLNLIRKIRNTFAHRSLPLDFEHGGLQNLRDRLVGDLDSHHLDRKEVFAAYCLAVTNLLRKRIRAKA
jgi:hypothetical protein